MWGERRRIGSRFQPHGYLPCMFVRVFIYLCIRVYKNQQANTMALKDIVAQKAQLTEEAIEAIISDYVRYDIEEGEIMFTPEATGLSNKAKVLVFLVAQQGWQFVRDEATDVGMAPSYLEEFLGIQGGTLRPILKDLKDRNLLAAKAGKYSIRSTGLDAIKAELDRHSKSKPQKPRKTKKRRTLRPTGDSDFGVDEPSVPKKDSVKRAKSSARAAKGLGEVFNGIVDEGFFDNGGTTAQLHTRLQERAIIIKRTSLPQYLLAAVRGGKLTREKQDVDGKIVWVYTSTKQTETTL